MSLQGAPQINRRALYASYAVGLFSGGQWDMMGIIIPLFAVFIGLSPGEIGLVVAARSALSVIFSIHGGILMDRLGVRAVGFWVSIAAALLPLLYPILGWFWGLVILQLFSGLIMTLAMASGQTYVNRVSNGDPTLLGRFSFVTRFGNFFGPVIIGLIWNYFGSWPTFLIISLWGVPLVISVLLIPQGAQAKEVEQKSIVGLVAIKNGYAQAITLAKNPTVTFILILTVLRNGPSAIQASFFVVYLDQIGISSATIGFLTGLSEVFVGFGSLFAGWFAYRGRAHWQAIFFVGSAILFISLTPFFAQLITLLILATAARGFAQGVNQPLIFSILSRSVSDSQQGVAVGLRNTFNRFSNIIIPIMMGFLVEWRGITESFIIIGIILIGGCISVALGVQHFRIFKR